MTGIGHFLFGTLTQHILLGLEMIVVMAKILEFLWDVWDADVRL